MFIHVRLATALIRAKLACARTRVVALAGAARRSLSEPIVRAVGIAATALAVVSALVCVTGCPAPTPPANGSISAAWSIRSANDGAISCDQVGARFAAVRLRNRATANVIATAFPCPNSPGTAQIAPGLYDVSFDLNGVDGARLMTAPDQAGVSIVSGRLTPLTPVTFTPVAASPATLVLSLATGATTNCQPTSAAGAGITGATITLVRASGGCAAVTFTRQRGAEQRGSYTVNCSSPQIAPCIEKNETLTTSLAPGAYIVHARGKVGAIDCWQRDDTLEVPAAGQTLSRTLGLLRANGPGC